MTKIFNRNNEVPRAVYRVPNTRRQSPNSLLGTRYSVLGFTLIELMIVISIILILVSISIPIYTSSIVHAKEAVLRDDLFTMRSCIDQYTLDKQKAPQSLQDLVSAGYLKNLPKDPFTGSSDTWQTTTDDTLMDPSQIEPGITDVHSGASGVGSDGTAYSSW
jgi:general secretion pathway protein G